jgi:hypothetical protein
MQLITLASYVLFAASLSLAVKDLEQRRNAASVQVKDLREVEATLPMEKPAEVYGVSISF